MKYRQYISYSLLAISGIFLLCTVFATDTGLANGLVTGKVLWFHLAMLLLLITGNWIPNRRKCCLAGN